MFVTRWPRRAEIGSVYCNAGASTVMCPRLLLNNPPPLSSTAVWAPENQPREGSYVEVDTRTRVEASRGRLAPPNDMPLSVVLFADGPRPNAEMPPATLAMPGTVDAIAVRSPAWSGETCPFTPSTKRSAAPTSAPKPGPRCGLGLAACT